MGAALSPHGLFWTDRAPRSAPRASALLFSPRPSGSRSQHCQAAWSLPKGPPLLSLTCTPPALRRGWPPCWDLASGGLTLLGCEALPWEGTACWGCGGLPREGGPYLDKGGHGPFPLKPSPRSHDIYTCPNWARLCRAQRGSWGFVSVLGDDRSHETLPPSSPFLCP